MEKLCSICGKNYEAFSFKNGYVCEECLHYIKSAGHPDSQVRVKK